MKKLDLGIHQSTYDAIFQHPVAHNLQWREVRSMLAAVSDSVEEAHSGNVKYVRNGQTLIVHPSAHKDVSAVEVLMQIRHFLERSVTASPAAISGNHFLVVIDHREARIYKTELHGTTPKRITPLDPRSEPRYLHNVGDNDNGQRKPELKSFYEAIAKTLKPAEEILILGSATGSSSAMDHLVAELSQHHPEIAKHVIGAVAANVQHMTDDQLLAEARAFYAARHPAPVS